MADKIDLTGINNDFKEETGNLVRRDSQIISQGFLDDLKEKRDASKNRLEGDYQHVAAIPTIFVEKWQREGFDIITDKSITLKQIVAKLKSENLEGFMATEKSI